MGSSSAGHFALTLGGDGDRRSAISFFATRHTPANPPRRMGFSEGMLYLPAAWARSRIGGVGGRPGAPSGRGQGPSARKRVHCIWIQSQEKTKRETTLASPNGGDRPGQCGMLHQSPAQPIQRRKDEDQAGRRRPSRGVGLRGRPTGRWGAAPPPPGGSQERGQAPARGSPPEGPGRAPTAPLSGGGGGGVRTRRSDIHWMGQGRSTRGEGGYQRRATEAEETPRSVPPEGSGSGRRTPNKVGTQAMAGGVLPGGIDIGSLGEESTGRAREGRRARRPQRTSGASVVVHAREHVGSGCVCQFHISGVHSSVLLSKTAPKQRRIKRSLSRTTRLGCNAPPARPGGLSSTPPPNPARRRPRPGSGSEGPGRSPGCGTRR